MKLSAGFLAFLLGINLILPLPVTARFATKQLRRVPISRLLRNIEAQREDAKGTTDKAMIDFQIGRLHAMAYALRVEDAPCDAAATPGSKFELPEFGHTPDHIQFRVDQNKKTTASAKEHLRLAIESLQKAVKRDPSLFAAKLGLAWCTEQSGDKVKALALYREVFSNAYDYEKNSKGGMYNWSITLETAGYLKPLLNPVKDKKELDAMQAKVSELEKLPRYITPIAIPLASDCKLEDMLLDQKVKFDLDGFGVKEYSKWLSAKAGWLVFDDDGKGDIDSGLKLIGQSSFWIFWRNGYEVLRSLDDNRDGQLRGDELAGLSIWQDKNCNGISELGEVKSLPAHQIVALAFSADLNPKGILWCKHGVVLKDGSCLPSYDFVLPKTWMMQAK